MQQRMKQLQAYAKEYKRELLEQVIPFWQKYSIDKQHGGFYTCLDQKGNVYDTDKFMWLQGRQVWTFSMIYNNIEKKKQWLDIALHGAQFMLKYGMDASCNWKTLDTTLQHILGLLRCYGIWLVVQGNKTAIKTYYNIINRKDNTKGPWTKSYPATRALRNFSLPMILCNLSLVLEDVIGSNVVDSMVNPLIDDIMNNFVDKEKGIIIENVGPNGEFVDCFDGRVINPGHGNQSMWFLMDLAIRYKNQKLIQRCTEILLNITKFGWDNQHGGIFYFKDIKGHPVQQLQWDQKLWWVHIESMISFLKAYKYTGNEQCKQWFLKLHDYTWNHFRDATNHGQWFGYLNRQGEVLLRLKGGKWKGCFHVPRGLYQLWKTIQM